MKKTVLFLILLALIKLSTAQNYIHFPDSNAIWTEVYWPYDDLIHPWIPSFHCYGLLNKDTIINSRKYHQLFKSNDTIFNESEYCGGIREDSMKRVFFFGDMTDMWGNVSNYFKYKEVLLYNFSVKPGDTLRNNIEDSSSFLYNWRDFHGWLVVESIDSVFMSGKYRKRINFENGTNNWVEGIGNIHRGLMFTPGAVTTNGPWNRLACIKQNDIWVYHNSYFSDCFPYYFNGIKETKNTNHDAVVFPNPITNISYIKFDNSVHQYEELVILDVTGIKIKSSQIKNQQTYRINKFDYSPGIYFFKAVAKDGYFVTGKFIID
jgi:hypothetical protein